MIKLGNQKVDLCKGSTLIKKAYRGSSLIYNRTNHIELEYLESDGNQWINTEYIPKSSNLKYDIHISTPNMPYLEENIVGYHKYLGGSFMIGFYNRYVFCYNNGNSNVVSTTFSGANDFFITAETKVDESKKYLTVNGVTTSGICNTLSDFSEIRLFYVNVNKNKFVGKMYHCKIYDNDTLVRDLIPVLDKNFEPCMYDKVSGKYLYNQGSGEFKWKLPNQLEYLESTGTQYIDTGFLSNQLYDKSLYVKMKTTGGTSSYAYNGAYHTSGTGLTIQFGLLATSNTLCRTTLNHFDPSYLNVTNLQKSEYTELMMTPTEYWVNGEFRANHEQTSIDKILETNNKFLIFGRSQYNQSNSITPMIISKFWIKDKDGKFVQYLIPVLDENLTPCMYDLVSKKYFYNNGTGQFKGYLEDGSQVVSYLESTGTQWIDTGLFGNQDTEIQTQFEISKSSQRVYGYYETNKNITAYESTDGGNHRFGNQTVLVNSPLNKLITVVHNKNGITYNGTLYAYNNVG